MSNRAARLIVPDNMPDWRKLLRTNSALWNAAKSSAGSGPKVLIATNIGGHGPVGVMESMLAVVLTLRGSQVYTMLCDGVLPGCLKAEHNDLPDPAVIADRKIPDTLCSGCIWRGESMVLPLGLGVETIGKNTTESERRTALQISEKISLEDFPDFTYEGLAVGEHAWAGTLRYFARGDLSNEPLGETVARRYLEASMLSLFAVRRLIDKHKFDVAVFHHGLYVPQGIVGEVCRKMGVRVVNWFVTYRRNTFLFSHHDTYHHTLIDESPECWENMVWTGEQEQQITDYLKSRWYGSRDWIAFHEKPEHPDSDFKAFAVNSGLDLSKPVIGILTNVVWDAQLHYPANVFSGMIEWVLETIGYFKRRSDLQLLIRIHPAELRGTCRSRQPLMDEIRKAFPVIPSNVHIIEPESSVSTYAAMEYCDSVIIYGTKTGVELTSVGIPTIVAGEAWIRNKGLTYDAYSVDSYFEILDQLPFGRRMDEQVSTRARKFAYHFFFRRMIPLPFMIPNGKGTLYSVGIEKLDEFLPGQSPGLDIICDGILKGTPFIYPAERLGIHDA